MKIVVPFKVVADDQDIVAIPGATLDFSKAQKTISAYDLNAIEAAAQLAATQSDASVLGISVGEAAIDDSKLKKNVLARGVDELFMVADDVCRDLDAWATSKELEKLLAQTDGYDLIVCGSGSADLFAQQVDVQLASRLDLPYLSGVVKCEIKGDKLHAERQLENEIETIELPLPAVISVLPDSALPRICGMKDILAAGKKPMHVGPASDVAISEVEVVCEKAPEKIDRKLELFEASSDGGLDAFIAAIKASL